jgi:hypothetical protein
VPKQYKIHQVTPICLFPPCPYLTPYIHVDSSPLLNRLDQTDPTIWKPKPPKPNLLRALLLNPASPSRWVRGSAIVCIGGSAKHKLEIDALKPASTVSSQHEHQHKTRRLRGGGAGRVGPVSFRLPPSAPLSSGSGDEAASVLTDAPRRASISPPRLTPLASSYNFPQQDCFIGLIECFICFGTYCFLPFRIQMMSQLG